MVKNIIFMDLLRQEEINLFYDACQMQREYYRGYANRHHPLTYFREPQYKYQCPQEMSAGYLSFPAYHVKYKNPPVLPANFESTTPFPDLPNRSLAGRYNKGPCKVFIR